MPVDPVLGYHRIRICNRIYGQTGSNPVEVVADLAHLHQGSWTRNAIQPGAPGSMAIGDFRIPLHPPGSEGFAANAADYANLLPGKGEGLRVEAYLGPGITTPHLAGIITEVNLEDGETPVFELVGKTDEWILNAQRPFPGEYIHNSAYDSLTIAKEFIGNHQVGVTDQFNPYTAGNYTSLTTPGGVAATWAAATDANGINSNVVSVTGAGAVGSCLVSKTSSSVGGDALDTVWGECFVRLKVASHDTSNAGQLGIGWSASSANTTNSIFGSVTAKWNTTTSRFDLDATIEVIASGVPTFTNYSSVLTNVDDPDGYIPLQIQLLTQYDGVNQAVRLIINGAPINALGTAPAFIFAPVFPFLYFTQAATGAQAIGYFTNLLMGNRTNDPYGMFLNGTFGTPVHKFRANQQPAPTFLDMLTTTANVESWLLRLTPISMTDASAVIAKVDLTAQPGTDHSTDVIFTKGENLVSIRQQGNADVFASDVQFNGYEDPSSGGVFMGRNIPAMQTYGWLSAVGMSLGVQDYPGLYRQGANVAANKGTPGASYVAKVLRDPSTADKFRELDYITIHDPTMGINHQKFLVVSFTFDEGQATQTLTLGQYGTAGGVTAARAFPGLQQIAGLFKNR